jgi:3-hydroxy-3-methylglutaryl CoA synthase
MATGITAWGAYVPRLRLERAAIAATHGWMAPSLKGLAKGRRAFCGWDEDVVTMAVEAARDCLGGRNRAKIGEIQLVSTSAPFADLQSSAIVSVALRLDRQIRALDLGGSQRAGVAALAAALETAKRPTLIIGSERPRARPASVQEIQYGAGAAAFVIGSEDIAAEIIGSASSTTLFVDHFRAADAPYDYFWEERWVRDEGYLKIGVDTVRTALAHAGVQPGDVSTLIFPSPAKGIADAIARMVGVPPAAVADPLDKDGGYAGSAHALLMLADTLDRASPGQAIVVGGFGQGSDVVVLRTTDAVTAGRPARGVAGSIAEGISVQSYAQMASFYDEIAPEWGMRSERDGKTALTEQYRSSEQIHGFVAGLCGACGQVQFPQLAYCVSCKAPASVFTPLGLAEEGAKVLTYTADALAYHPAPPLYIGFAQFDVGARLLMEFVDVEPGTFDVGTRLGMRFRIKERDRVRGYNRYFWKAAPVAGQG